MSTIILTFEVLRDCGCHRGVDCCEPLIRDQVYVDVAPGHPCCSIAALAATITVDASATVKQLAELLVAAGMSMEEARGEIDRNVEIIVKRKREGGPCG